MLLSSQLIPMAWKRLEFHLCREVDVQLQIKLGSVNGELWLAWSGCLCLPAGSSVIELGLCVCAYFVCIRLSLSLSLSLSVCVGACVCVRVCMYVHACVCVRVRAHTS